MAKWQSGKVVSACGVLFLGSLLGACHRTTDASLAGPPYPAEKAQSRTLDIQVVRTQTTIQLTNTTARAYGKSRLWINEWYSREIPGLAVGQTIELDQDSFRDQYGEAFRAGGFFATRTPQVVEQVQLETEDSMLGLVAVGKPSE